MNSHPGRIIKPRGTPVLWEGVVVGYMLSHNIDNWNIYGKWQAEDSSVAREFLRRLANGEELQIKVGTSDAYLSTEPHDTIEFRLL